MSNTIRKARKRQHRAALTTLAVLERSTNRSHTSRVQLKAHLTEVAETAYLHPAKAATPLLSRAGFFTRPKAKVIRDLSARGIKITAKMSKDIDAADTARRAQLKARGGRTRNFNR